MQTVAVDLDGVLAQYDKWRGVEHIGKPILHAKQFMQELIEMGHHVVVYTTRTNPDVNGRAGDYTADELAGRIHEWLADNDIPYHEVYVGAGKPIASAYVDDRAVECRPQEDASSYGKALLKVAQLTHVIKQNGDSNYCNKLGEE